MFRKNLKIDGITLALERVAVALTDMTPMMQDIGEVMLESTKDNFRQGSDPDGTPWAPKSAATLDAYARRGDGRPSRPLIGPTKTLFTKINYQAGPNRVAWGSNVIQAAVMQLGASKGAFGTTSRGSPIPWGGIPARPYIGIGGDDQGNILETIEDYLETAADG